MMVSPVLLAYTGWSNVQALNPDIPGTNAWSFNGGVDQALQNSIGATDVLDGAARHYNNLATLTYSAGNQLDISMSRFFNRIMLNLRVTTASGDAYLDATLNDIVAGTYDAAILAHLNSFPDCWMRFGYHHEYDINISTSSKVLGNQAQAHILDVTTQWAVDGNKDPNKVGFMVILTGYSMDQPNANGYNWYDYISGLSADQMKYVVAAEDTYCRYISDGYGGYRPESITEVLTRHRAIYAERGITRMIVPETALAWDTDENLDVSVGTLPQTIAWHNELIACLESGLVEAVGIFSSPTGFASKFGDIFNLAGGSPVWDNGVAKIIALAMNKINRVDYGLTSAYAGEIGSAVDSTIDVEYEFLSQLLEKDDMSLADLRAEYFVKALAGTLPGGGSGDTTVAGITDATAEGKALLLAISAAAQRTLLEVYSTTEVGTAITNAVAVKLQWRGAVSTIAYAVNDLVYQASTNGIYRCKTAHTSGGAIASDGDATYWEYICPYARVQDADDLPSDIPAIRVYSGSWPARSTVTTDTTRTVINLGGTTGPADNTGVDIWIPASA